jgi:hypothetical protein
VLIFSVRLCQAARLSRRVSGVPRAQSVGSQIAVSFENIELMRVTGTLLPSSTRPSARTQPLQFPHTQPKLNGLLMGTHTLVCRSKISPLGDPTGPSGSVLYAPPITNAPVGHGKSLESARGLVLGPA